MIEQRTQYGFSVTVPMSFDVALQRTRDELAREGFGVLTEIDVSATLEKKLGVAFRPYVILGACNPTLAHRALTADLDIGLLLPCNVVVYSADVPGWTVVGAMDPAAALELAGNAAIVPVAAEAKARLGRALDRVAARVGDSGGA